jgi:hypothetical protein
MTSSFPGKNRSPIDQLISEFDTALRSIAGGAHYRRPIPKTELENDLNNKQVLRKILFKLLKKHLIS